MTKKEILKGLDSCLGTVSNCDLCPLNNLDDCADILFEETEKLIKENEPAPAGTDTSSNIMNYSQVDNNTLLKFCQTQIEDMCTTDYSYDYVMGVLVMLNNILDTFGKE